MHVLIYGTYYLHDNLDRRTWQRPEEDFVLELEHPRAKFLDQSDLLLCAEHLRDNPEMMDTPDSELYPLLDICNINSLS